MDWLKELLEKEGLADEAQVTAIIEEYKKEAPKHTIPKDVYNTALERSKTAEETLADRDQQLADLQKKAGAGSELEEEITRLREENKQTKEKYEAELKQARFDHAITQNLMAARAKDINIARAAFNLQNVTLDEQGNLVGFDEQLKAVQEAHDYLFESDTPSGTGGSLGNRGAGKPQLSKEDFAKMSYTERVALKAKDPDTYNLMTNKEE